MVEEEAKEAVSTSLEEEEEEALKERGKHDIKALVAVIPPATALKGAKQAKIPEKRIRVRWNAEVKPEQAKINPKLAGDLGITDKLELVVAGRHKFVLTAVLDENVPYNEVWANEDLLKEHGVADNSIATVRRARA